MGRIISSFFISLDGVVEAADQWYSPYFDAAMGAAIEKGMQRGEAFLLGRKLYEEWAAYWPQADDDEFGPFITNLPKYVVSPTLTAATWHNTTLLRGDVAGEVRALKERTEGSINMSGCATTVRWLLSEGLLDELELFVHPVVVGHQQRLFADGSDHWLRLLDSARSTRGCCTCATRRPGEPESLLDDLVTQDEHAHEQAPRAVLPINRHGDVRGPSTETHTMSELSTRFFEDRFMARSVGAVVDYRVLVPADRSPGEPLPLVLHLHGAMSSSESLVLARPFYDELAAAGQFPRAVVAWRDPANGGTYRSAPSTWTLRGEDYLRPNSSELDERCRRVTRSCVPGHDLLGQTNDEGSPALARRGRSRVGALGVATTRITAPGTSARSAESSATWVKHRVRASAGHGPRRSGRAGRSSPCPGRPSRR